MGGGTGTGAAPIVCEMAREAGALCVGIVTKPFLFEGRKRMRQAEMGIAEMRKHVDTMIVVPNERLLAVVGKGIPFQDALKKADEVLLHATQGISSLISVTGLVNVDFADVRTVMQAGGSALMGTGVGRGENRAMEAAQQAIASPLLDNVSISGATGVLVNITGGADLTLGEVHQINEIVHDAVGDDAEIIFGAVNEPAMQGEIRVTVIATGFDRAQQAHAAQHALEPPAPPPAAKGGPAVIPFNRAGRHTTSGTSRPAAGAEPVARRPVVPAAPVLPERRSPSQDLTDMEIPTFIRRQMD
jgi:cell division protein FtsZ